MNYRIARNGQVYGPYTPDEVVRYLASGNILLSDFAQAEGAAEWVPVSQVFASAAVPGYPSDPTDPGSPSNPSGAGYAGAAGYPTSEPGYAGTPAGYAAEYPVGGSAGYAAYATASPAAASMNFDPQRFADPPDLPWWLALILGILTGGVFFVVWDIVQAAWMRRVEPRSNALYLYVVAGVLFLINLQASWHSITYWMFDSPFVPTHHSGFVALLRWAVWLAARFVLRSELLTHFNAAEPVGLRLNGFLTLILGGLYFQFHFNQINAIKRSMRHRAVVA